MSSILISSQSYTNASEIARRVADLLDYRRVDSEVFEMTSSRFGVPEAKVREAFTRGPSFLGMSDATRKRSLAYFQATLSALLLDDGLVYHGPFAHALITGVSHILRVSVVASTTRRREELERVEGLAPKKAERKILADDERCREISTILFGKDVSHEGFDLVVDVDEDQHDAAAKVIAETVGEKRYVPMTFSRKVMQEVELTHRLRAMLVDLDADTAVEVVGGGVSVRAHASSGNRSHATALIERRLHGIEGIEQLQVRVFDNDLMSAGRR